ncbi:MAG TPA: PH domain-containing protein [Candidatus Saccharibacteria bacterium]|nr:PH domain-containing protein [Candidatus Saccharibacteria bacterium]HRQ07251.1 PH domain-containing protein [Candidatus Saccharibacteria bacterium]
MQPDSETPNLERPVAYDANGQPLYAHPPAQDTSTATEKQVVHVARLTEPIKQEISDATKLKNERSKQMFPELNLTDGEYVISAVRRHPIGLVLPLGIGTILVALGFAVLFNLSLFTEKFLNNPTLDNSVVALFVLLYIGLVIGGTYIAYFIYTNNKFYLTNESVIQEIQTGLFAKHEQTVSLGNVEDASYFQHSLLQQLLNYGSIRLSTQGDETTYRFSYATNPKEHIAALNNAVEAFKNGRPVSGD